MSMYYRWYTYIVVRINLCILNIQATVARGVVDIIMVDPTVAMVDTEEATHMEVGMAIIMAKCQRNNVFFSYQLWTNNSTE